MKSRVFARSIRRELHIRIHAASTGEDQQGDGWRLAEFATQVIAAGADGVAFINRSAKEDRAAKDVFVMQVAVRRFLELLHYERRCMINVLGGDSWLGLDLACHTLGSSCAVWMDSTDLCEEGRLRNCLDSGMRVFGGIGFKYQDESQMDIGWKLAMVQMAAAEDRRGAAFARSAGQFIAMTTGAKTGVPPQLGYLGNFRRLLGPELPLAVASGITAENISDFLPLATHFIVGTSVETEAGIDLGRVTELAQIIGAFNEAL